MIFQRQCDPRITAPAQWPLAAASPSDSVIAARIEDAERSTASTAGAAIGADALGESAVIGWFIQGRVVEQGARSSAAVRATVPCTHPLQRIRVEADIAQIAVTHTG